MKKLLFSMLLVAFCVTAMAQQTIQLRSANKAECVKSDLTSLKASFSFSTIEAQDYESERGTFSWLSLPNTVLGGNEGDPQIPVVNQLIAVPFGANPSIEITSYSTTDYRLEDYGIKTLVPRQPSLRKDQKSKDVPFIMNEAAYQTRGFRNEPTATIDVVGTMRGVRLGKLGIEPVSYDPVNNTIRVFNDIEVTVRFDGADRQATEQMLVETYSPYFDIVYKSLFNGRAIADAYTNYPDLYTTPVKMLVVTTSTYANSAAFENWLTWKKQKGIYVDVQTVANGASASTVRSTIQNRYNANHPTFLVIIGDKADVTNFTTWTKSGLNYNPYISDNQYASIDNDVYHDMFMSRMSVSSTTELQNLVNKIMMYEKYEMSDPSYLNKTLLVAGWDNYGWTSDVGKPTIQYANNNYFNSAHGITPYVYITTGSQQTECWNYISQVGFSNYTAHGDITEMQNPRFQASQVASMTNTNKPMWHVANCCLTANWGHSDTCLGETMIRANNRGAFGYIGSIPESYWYEDYYFGVGAFNYQDGGAVQTVSGTTMGMYDAMFDETGFNCLNAMPYIGNVAVTYAHAAGYAYSVNDEYYWRAYQTLGDGSVMPYLKVPAANNVSHASTIGIGMTTFVVNADAGSYVAITKNNEILGVAQANDSGVADVQISDLNSAGDVMIVVTRNQRQPYIQTIQAVPMDGPYISVDGYTPTEAHVSDDTNLSITFKNVGTASTSGTTTVTLTPGDDNVTVDTPTKTFAALAVNATTTVDGFSFHINPGVADGTNVTLHYAAVNGSNTWEGDLVVSAVDAILEYQNMTWDGDFVPGETITVSATFKNVGHYQATNAQVALTSSNEYVIVNTQPISEGTIEVGQEVTYNFTITIAANCPETEQLPITFTMTADGGLSATGNETLKNACNVVFNLVDSYGDGWNNAALVVSFDDGTDPQNLTISDGSSAEYILEIGNGVHVTLSWTSGSYDGECSFTVSYEGDLVIFSQTARPSAGVLYEFDCNCSIASQTFTITATSSNTEQGTVSGGGEFNYGESCTVIATPAEGYMFTNWTQNGEIVAGAGATYTFAVTSDMDLVANFAEGLLIGDGSTDTHQYLPSYNYYTNSFSEQIYTSDELGAAGIITGIAFFNGGAEKTLDYDFYMKATTKDSFTSKTDWIAVSESDKVFSGSVTVVANDWTTITFSTPFVYDGTSNVVLVTDKQTQWSSSPHMSCRVFSTSSSQAIYAYDDNVDFNPMSPSSSSVNNNDVLQVKNQIIVTKTGFDGCVNTAPTTVEVGNITHAAATVTWTGFSESYNVNLGIANITTLADEDFSNSIPTNWTNDATYPWTIVNGHIQSGNVGEHGTTSSVSITVTFPADGTVEFDAECMGEGSSTYYDHCDFIIDETTQLTAGANISGWNHYIYEVTAGEHTFTWSYTKDGSVNPTGDYFAVDNVLMIAGEITWNALVAVEDAEYTFSGLTPETDYCVRVQGVCDNTESAWSNVVMFTTLEGPQVSIFTKTIEAYSNSQAEKGGYYLIASPLAADVDPATVNGMITDNLGNTATTSNSTYDLYSFDQAETDEWQNYRTSSFNMVNGQGYLYASKGGTTLTFTGASGTNGQVNLVYDSNAEEFAGWNLVGNPFGEDAYITKDFYTLENSDTYTPNTAGTPIHAMQGLLVVADEDGETLTFTLAETPVGNNNKLNMNVTKDHGLIDRAIVSFTEGQQLPKLQFRNGSTKVYIPQEGKDYAIVSAESMGTMPVNFKAESNGTYTLSFTAEEVSFAYLHLIDNMTGEDVDLLAGASTGSATYTFEAKTTDYESRFRLVFATKDGLSTGSGTFAFYSIGSFVIYNEGNATLQVIDINGRILKSESINGCANVNVNAAQGIYMLRLVNGESVKVQKVVVK